MEGEGNGVQEDEVISLGRGLLILAIVPVIAISVGNDATQKESNDHIPTYSSGRSLFPGSDYRWGYDSPLLDEGRRQSVERALLLLIYAQSLERIHFEERASSPSPGSLSASTTGEVASVVCQPEVFTWDCQWAVDTVYCESKNDPNVSNPIGPYNGWWQVTNGPFDPYLNTVEAHIQYHQWIKGERPDPWPNC